GAGALRGGPAHERARRAAQHLHLLVRELALFLDQLSDPAPHGIPPLGCRGTAPSRNSLSRTRGTSHRGLTLSHVVSRPPLPAATRGAAPAASRSHAAAQTHPRSQ